MARVDGEGEAAMLRVAVACSPGAGVAFEIELQLDDGAALLGHVAPARAREIHHVFGQQVEIHRQQCRAQQRHDHDAGHASTVAPTAHLGGPEMSASSPRTCFRGS